MLRLRKTGASSPQPDKGAIFDIWQLLAQPRVVNEAIIRGLCRNAYIGDHTALCRVLGRYKMFVDTRDLGIASHLLMDGFWEMWVTEAMLRHVRPGMTVLDIGANLGYFTVLLADLTGPTGKVLSFEPNPAMNSLLRRSIEVNGVLPWTRLHEIALGDSAGDVAINARLDHPGGAHIVRGSADRPDGVKVPVRRLDSITDALDADFIKMDVEGYEQHVWRGMTAILARKRAMTIFMEFTVCRFPDPDLFLDEIMDHGFSLGIVDYKQGVRPCTREELFAQPHTIDHMLVFQRTGTAGS